MSGPGQDRDAGRSHVVLVGMMGAGKTTTGLALASRLGWRFVDSDAAVEAGSGGTGARLAASEGVGALHELEASILVEALASPQPAVIAAAASVVESRACRDALALAARVVWLDVPVAELCQRAAAGSHRRSMAMGAAEAVLARRLARFAQVADLRVDGRQPTERVVATVLRELSRS